MTNKEKKGGNLPLHLKVLPSATDKDILVAGIAKNSAFNKRFDGKAEYRFVLKPFTLNRYKEQSGFGYSRIVFYLLPTERYL